MLLNSYSSRYRDLAASTSFSYNNYIAFSTSPPYSRFLSGILRVQTWYSEEYALLCRAYEKCICKLKHEKLQSYVSQPLCVFSSAFWEWWLHSWPNHAPCCSTDSTHSFKACSFLVRGMLSHCCSKVTMPDSPSALRPLNPSFW